MNDDDGTNGTTNGGAAAGVLLARSAGKWIADGVEYVPVSTMLDRIEAKNSKLSEAIRQRDDAVTARDAATALSATADTIRTEYHAYRTQIEQSDAFRAVGLDGDEHDTIRARLLRFHAADVADHDADARPGLSAWLESQRSDPVIGHLLPAVPSSDIGDPPVESGAASSAPVVAAPSVGGGRAPAPQRKLSIVQMEARHRELLTAARGAVDPAERSRLFESARQLLTGHRRG